MNLEPNVDIYQSEENGRSESIDEGRHSRRSGSRDRSHAKKRHSRSRRRSGSHGKRRHSRSKDHKSPAESNGGGRIAGGRRTKRRKPSKYWDVAPPGFEHMTPTQYKQLQKLGQIPTNTYTVTNAPCLDGGYISMQTRRVYIGGIPFGLQGDQMVDFFNQKMHENGLVVGPGNPVLACQINIDKNFAFLEFRTAEETTAALAFDGIILMGQALKLRRPKDYVPLAGSSDAGLQLAGVPLVETQHKIYVGGLPNYLTEEQVKELLMTFGQLKSFSLIKEPVSGMSKGFAFCEYMDEDITDEACKALNGMQLGDKYLTVRRANQGARNAQFNQVAMSNVNLNHQPVVPQIPGVDPSSNQSIGHPTEVLSLMNMLEIDDLIDDEEYDEIMDDVKTECNKYGTVRSLEIPRPLPGTKEGPGVGKIFVEFTNVIDCQKAMSGLAGRKFQNRTVVTTFFEVDRYHRREFD